MKKIIIAFVMTLVIASSASALQLNISGDLTPEQKAQIILQAEQMAAKTPDIPVKAEEIREWVEVGSAIGEGMAAAAGKLGVEANKFANTTVGTVTMVALVYNYIGESLIRVMFGASLFMFGIPLWLWFYTTKASKRLDTETLYEKGKGPDNKTVVREYVNTSEDIKGWSFAFLIVLMILGTLTIIV